LLAGLSLTCNPFAKRPSVPVVTGPDAGVAGMPLTFKATSEDPDGDSVAFMFDWGDTMTKVWTNFIPSGETISVSHTYADSNNYVVRAKAKNGKSRESDWCGSHALALVGKGEGYPDSLAAEIGLTIHGQISSVVAGLDGAKLYLAVPDDDRVLVMRTTDFSVVDEIAVGSAPQFMMLSLDGQCLYVADAGADSVVLIRTSDDSITGKVAVGREPRCMAQSPGGAFLYSANMWEDSIAVVRVLDRSVTAKFHTDSVPVALAVSEDGSRLYVVSSAESTVAVFDAATHLVLTKLKLPSYGTCIGVTQDGREVMAGSASGAEGTGACLSVISTAQNAIDRSISLDATPLSIVMSSNGAYAFAPTAEFHGTPVIRIDRDVVVGFLKSAGLLGSAAMAPDGTKFYAADWYRRKLCVFVRSGAWPP
jgi:DNA-binding beta-propeller fold protein YncE